MARPNNRTGRGARSLRNEDGIALIEFAMVLPVVLAVALGGIELANLSMAHVKVNQIAESVADNAGRVSSRVDESDINEIFSGARMVGKSIDFEAHGRVILSSLQENKETDAARKGQMINWQRCMGALRTAPKYGVEGKGRTDNSLQAMGKAGRQIAALTGTAVMFVEVTYEYQPLINAKILGPRTIRYESAFNVRERTEHDITNVQVLTQNTC